MDRAPAPGASVLAGRGDSSRRQRRDARTRRGRRVTTTAVELSIVLPVFNEAQSLPVLWEELQAVLKTVEDSAEVIMVDDGSTDSSVEFVRLLQATDSRVRLIRLAANRGLSSALAAGLRAVRGRIVVTLDSDLQSDPGDIPLLLRSSLDRWTRRAAGARRDATRGSSASRRESPTECAARCWATRCATAHAHSARCTVAASIASSSSTAFIDLCRRSSARPATA